MSTNEDFIRRELEREGLSIEQRMELLRLLGKLEAKKLDNTRLQISRRVGRVNRVPAPLSNLERPGEPTVEEAPAAKPMGELVDEALAQYERDKQEKHDGSGEQHEHSGSVGHPAEGAAGGKPGA